MKKGPSGDTLDVSRKTSTEEARSKCCTLDSTLSRRKLEDPPALRPRESTWTS